MGYDWDGSPVRSQSRRCVLPEKTDVTGSAAEGGPRPGITCLSLSNGYRISAITNFSNVEKNFNIKHIALK